MFYKRSHPNAGNTWLTNCESKWRCLKRRMFVATTTSLDWRDVATPSVTLAFFSCRKGIFLSFCLVDRMFSSKYSTMSVLLNQLNISSMWHRLHFFFLWRNASNLNVDRIKLYNMFSLSLFLFCSTQNFAMY